MPTTGRRICDILKSIRREIALRNGIYAINFPSFLLIQIIFFLYLRKLKYQLL